MNFIIKVDYSYPTIKIAGVDTSDMNDYIHEYCIKNSLSDEEKVKFIDREVTEVFKMVCQELNIQFRDSSDKKEIDTDTFSGVPIKNPDDITEVAIKQNLQIGQINEKGYAGLYKAIGGVPMLRMKKRDGTIVETLDGGKQKKLAQMIVKQYMDVAERKDIGKNAIQYTDIFSDPILTIFDGRGKHTMGFYTKRLLPIFINNLIDIYENKVEMEHIFTNVTKISKEIRLVNKEYKNNDEKLKTLDKRFTIKMVNQFYTKANREIEMIIFKMLDNLQDNYSVISYEKNFYIITKQDKHTSNSHEKSIIRKSQVAVLKEFKAKNMFTIFARNQTKNFYERVVGYINEKYNLDWIGYRNQIEIIIEDLNRLKEIQKELSLEEEQLQIYLEESKSRLATKLYRIVQADYEKSNQKEINAIIENPEIDDIYKELIKNGIYTVRDLVNRNVIKNPPFHYWESTIETQHDLITLMIGHINYTLSDTELKQLESELPN